MTTDTMEGPDRAPPSRRAPSAPTAALPESSVSAVDGEVAGIRVRRWSPATVRASVVFCHGFMTQPRDYDRLVHLIASRGIEVVAPVGHRRDLHALRGLRTVDDEAHDVERVVTAIDPSVVAGHSRGALVAWIVAGGRPDGGVIAVDPVIGDVRRGPAARFDPRRAPGHVLVVGAERPGRCAPTGFDDRTVAAATPPNHRFPTMPGTHAILPMGHADLLDPFARFVGGLLCGGNTDPALVRATVAALIGSAALGHPSVDAVGGHLPTVEWIVARA